MQMCCATRFIAVAVAVKVAACMHICGNYCGPHWCNGKSIPEDHCDDSAPPTSPADDCCKQHDACCKHYDLNQPNGPNPCNKKIVECLSKISASDLSCRGPTPGFGKFIPRGLPFISNGGDSPVSVPISPEVIEQTMNVVENWCCGHPCSSPGLDNVAGQNNTVFSKADHKDRADHRISLLGTSANDLETQRARHQSGGVSEASDLSHRAANVSFPVENLSVGLACFA